MANSALDDFRRKLRAYVLCCKIYVILLGPINNVLLILWGYYDFQLYMWVNFENFRCPLVCKGLNDPSGVINALKNVLSSFSSVHTPPFLNCAVFKLSCFQMVPGYMLISFDFGPYPSQFCHFQIVSLSHGGGGGDVLP